MACKDDVTKKERSYVTITTCQRKKGIIILNFTIHLKFKQASLFPRFPKDDWACHVNMQKTNHKQK